MCCCSLKKDVKLDLKEDVWQLILKGKILVLIFFDRVEVLNYYIFLFIVCIFFNRNLNVKKKVKMYIIYILKKIMYI